MPVRVLAKCDAEVLELWLLPELRDELDAPELEPPEELLWELEPEEPPELAELPELTEPPPPEECSAMRGDETNNRETMTRAESRIKHLQADWR